jgi:hypothetical protein
MRSEGDGYFRRIYDLPRAPNISLVINSQSITKRIFWQAKSRGINENPAICESSIIIIICIDDVLKRIGEITVISDVGVSWKRNEVS